MTKGVGWVGFGSGQLGCGLNRSRVILRGLKMSSSQLGCELGRVDRYFSHEFLFLFFIFIKKITCICYLKSYATNYLM